MIGFFKRATPPAEACDLGRSAVALPMRAGCAAPPGCPVVIVDAGGRTRRATAAAGKPVPLRDGELAWTYHPGPYTVDLVPFAQAPELGLRTSFAVDAAEALAQQRFDLYLSAEAAGRLDLAELGGAIEAALQRELAQGGLDLPPCTTIEEWNAFRQGLNQLLYMRFGLTVDDCVPVDLGETRDHAALLAARAAGQPATQALDGAPLPPPVPALQHESGERFEPAVADARALRRLFLELPCLMCGLRGAALPSGQDLFRRQQALLQRLDVLSVGANAMPALALAAPGQPLDAGGQLRRARHSRRATVALDEAWALLARMRHGGQSAPMGDAELGNLYDEAERIVANLEADCASRRAVRADVQADLQADMQADAQASAAGEAA
ncbi:hypothetical protein [Massilia sp. TN1-12]|uniref:hypothetical protein n=1 Tax=Massilia paldalensis TaxID=3377675 RepID=UPI00384BE029